MIEQYLNSRAYYNKSTGEILCFTNESFNMDGLTVPTLQDDKQNYEILTTIADDNLGIIELEFGTSFDIITKSKSYKMNSEQGKPTLAVEYYTAEELKAMEYIQVDNSEQNNDPIPVDTLEQENANLLLELVQKDILISQLQGGV